MRWFWGTVLALTLASFGGIPAARAEGCDEEVPGRAVLTWNDEEGESLFQAVFTPRHGTIHCLRLLEEQYGQREEKLLPEGFKPELGRVGPLDLVTTWDTAFLPFALTHLGVEGDKGIRRVLQDPVNAHREQGWRPGMPGVVGANVPTEGFDAAGAVALAAELLYEIDPTYVLTSATEDEVVYVWPDPDKDDSPFFVERRFRKTGTYRLELTVTLYNFADRSVPVSPLLQVTAFDMPGSGQTGFLAPPANLHEAMCMAGDDFHRYTAADLSKFPEGQRFGGDALWAGVGNRYFMKALVPQGMRGLRCRLRSTPNRVITAELYLDSELRVKSAEACYPDWYRPASREVLRCSAIAKELEIAYQDLLVPRKFKDAVQRNADRLAPATLARYRKIAAEATEMGGWLAFTFEIYAGPKDIKELQKSNVGLEKALDFWVVGFLAKPMLHLLRWFHTIIPHWAVAIVLLTILIKLLLLPVTHKSFKQMQKMATLKPLMDEVKAKYGDNKERLNQEMMALYKREKMNPVGGCLPMLLQMPIWIALYRTIYTSVELYQAPLGLWIQDLSQPDKYFVLPVLLGVSMFVQQKLTPTTMDSAQAKMMLWFMPILFTVFMLFLPSGLNLYIFVNTLLSMLQQWHLRKDATPKQTARARA